MISDETTGLINVTVRMQVWVLKRIGWTFIVLGIPMLLLMIGFVMIPMGMLMLWIASKLQKKLTPEYIHNQLNGGLSVVAEKHKNHESKTE